MHSYDAHVIFRSYPTALEKLVRSYFAELVVENACHVDAGITEHLNHFLNISLRTSGAKLQS